MAVSLVPGRELEQIPFSLAAIRALPAPIPDDRWLLVLLKPRRGQEPNVSIVPSGTDISFCIISQHFVLGYFY